MGKTPFGLLDWWAKAHAPLYPLRQVGAWVTGLKGIWAKAQVGRWLRARLPLRTQGTDGPVHAAALT